jgi:rRNA maturation endonuclease Nob1
MNAAALIRNRRRNADKAAAKAARAAHLTTNKARTISTHVRKVADANIVKGATEALRKVAKKLRDAGSLGKVSAFIRKVDGVARLTYRYTARQLAVVAADYSKRVRKAEYKQVAAFLTY